MKTTLHLHDVEKVVVADYHYYEATSFVERGFVGLKLVVRCEDGSTAEINLYSGKSGDVRFSAPALENRACAECHELMPRHYHARVTVCSRCETDGAPERYTHK